MILISIARTHTSKTMKSLMFLLCLIFASTVSGQDDECPTHCTCNPDKVVCVISYCFNLDIGYVDKLEMYGQICHYMKEGLKNRYGSIILWDDDCDYLQHCT